MTLWGSPIPLRAGNMLNLLAGLVQESNVIASCYENRLS
jgi:hypothetical protein